MTETSKQLVLSISSKHQTITVDLSPLRRVNHAIYLLTTGAHQSAFWNIKIISECLADELMNAAKGSSNSSAIKKDEIERLPMPIVKVLWKPMVLKTTI
ncbi:hypothetical protein M0R45_007954 [Rubus argutus]|uniref:Small ribosomal subunit protein uS7 domain-containing protein n=1 Tax=Rubus argutus TaxID=59490 RepID=A0AAW1Y032_RUBAR